MNDTLEKEWIVNKELFVFLDRKNYKNEDFLENNLYLIKEDKTEIKC